MKNQTTRDELKATNYELFTLASSLLSLYNWIAYFFIRDVNIQRVLIVID